jgi:hypothetical protein
MPIPSVTQCFDKYYFEEHTLTDVKKKVTGVLKVSNR